ncbi:MAG: hypothetical protein FK733_01800 [Asgard group archaeon]|nr:hypothetical protein [Asgard group archaeon]
MEKERIANRILWIVLIILAVSITSLIAYAIISPNRCRAKPELFCQAFEVDFDNNSINVAIINNGGGDGIIIDLSQIELVNCNTTQNPIDVTNYNQQSVSFPIKIEFEEVLNITCIFADPIDISEECTLNFYYYYYYVLTISLFPDIFLSN